MVEVFVWNLHTKNVNILRGICKLKVPWGVFIQQNKTKQNVVKNIAVQLIKL